MVANRYFHSRFLLVLYMKKTLLFLFLGLSSAGAARAQAALVNAVGAGIGFGRMLHKKSADKADSKVTKNATTETYQGKSFPMQRTPADQLPKTGAEQVTALETELDRCHTALLADANGTLFTPEQRQALQTSLVALARAQANGNLSVYQQEAAFYLAEDARRQPAAAPAK